MMVTKAVVDMTKAQRNFKFKMIGNRIYIFNQSLKHLHRAFMPLLHNSINKSRQYGIRAKEGA